MRAPSARQFAAGQGVVRDDRHIPHRRAGQRGRHGVLGEGEGQARAQPVARRCPRACSWPAPGASAGMTKSTARAFRPSLVAAIVTQPSRGPSGGVGGGAYGVLDRPAAWGDTCAAPQALEEGVRVPRRRIGFWYRLAAVIAKPPLVVLIKRDWRGMEHIPADGGFITAVNHNSHIDPFAYAHFQYNTGRVPRFLAKSGLFKKGFVGAMMRGTGQIPVYRETHGRAERLPGRDRRRGTRRMRRLLPRGHPHPGPRPVADDRQDRRRARGPADQVPGHPGRPVGRQRAAAAVRQEARTLLPRKTRTCSPARPWTCRASTTRR